MSHARKKKSFTSRLARCRRALTSYLGEQSGNVLVLTGLMFPVLFGMAGLGMDATVWYMEKRENQTIADNAAMAAIIEYSRNGQNLTGATTAAIADAKRNGFVNGIDGQVLVSAMATCGVGGATANCIQVLVSEQRALYMSQFVLDGPVTIQTRAAGGISTFGEHCVVALSPDADDAIRVDGNANATIGCGIASNSSSDTAIGIYGSADLTASPVQAYGDVYDANGGLHTATPPQPLSERVADPYAAVYIAQDLIDPACSSGGTGTVVASTTLDPGYYCRGLKITGNVDLNPGVYVMDGGDFEFTGGLLNGTGVTIVLTAHDPAYIGKVVFSGGGNVDLRAPGAGGHVSYAEDPSGEFMGQYAGLLFLQDPDAPCCTGGGSTAVKNMITGTGAMDLLGALYFPSQKLVYSGSSANVGGCTLLYADTVDFEGTAFISNDTADCIAAGIDVATQTRVRLTE